MAKYKVYHIVRDGHVQRDVIHAKNRQDAMAEAKDRFDDIIKVRRTGSTSGGFVFFIVVIVVVVLIVMSKG